MTKKAGPDVKPPEFTGGFVLNGEVSYRLYRERRRSVSLRITENGLEVYAPMSVSLAEIERFISEKKAWVLKHINNRKQWQMNRGLDRVCFRDDGEILYRGGPLRLILGESTFTEFMNSGFIPVLKIALPKTATEQEVRDIVSVWFYEKAKQVIGERYTVVSANAPKVATSWCLSNARTQWGSCSADGSMRFSWRLIYFEDDVIDYVIAHELAHRVQMNHSEKFWQIVGEIYPNFEASRAKLKNVLIKDFPI